MYIPEWSPFEFKLAVQLKYRSKLKYDSLWVETYPYIEKAIKELGKFDWAEANTPRKHKKWFRGTYGMSLKNIVKIAQIFY